MGLYFIIVSSEPKPIEKLKMKLATKVQFKCPAGTIADIFFTCWCPTNRKHNIIRSDGGIIIILSNRINLRLMLSAEIESAGLWDIISFGGTPTDRVIFRISNNYKLF